MNRGCYNCGGVGFSDPIVFVRVFSQVVIWPPRAPNQEPRVATTGEEGHYSRDCPQAGGGDQGYQSYSGGRGRGGGGGGSRNCYTCGGVGHLSRDCVGDQKCFNCGEVGHVSRDCSRPQAKNCYAMNKS
ncbi:hypothetical protein PGTUg99_005624 [Puccinia graminis f. sp. tritici]|uniref:CCHC-type domain-containing protein n=1 Tax=Puccinia graminis f. sp. tritici TaxID=56615 RepID=A0A5B0R037_PUCGR|nr:hypothetical protein PGTUg99_005624 [Puccinia graminis f. sp. tritici]